MDEKILEQLNYEQQQIINAPDRLIMVSAGPGSGKTYTLVEMIKKELNNSENHQGIIACSFTRESSLSIKRACDKQLIDLSDSFVGTLDAFILCNIIAPYKNRIRSILGFEPTHTRLKIKVGRNNKQINNLLRFGKKEEVKQYYINWLKNFKNDIYEISFPCYILALKALKELPCIKSCIESKFKMLAIDEAQDLNKYQSFIIDFLKDSTSIKIVEIGDPNQSIYKFRGSFPELFVALEDKGYKKYTIQTSARCHPSILAFSHLIVEDEFVFENLTENRVFQAKNLSNISFYDEMKGDYMILFEKRDDAQHCYNFLKDRIKQPEKLIYQTQIDIKDTNIAEDYMDIIEEILFFYFNFDNPNRKLIYNYEDFNIFLSNYIGIEPLKIDQLDTTNKSASEFLFYMLDLLDINLDFKTKKEIECELTEDCVINYYFRRERVNRIMTIHASKGLEADNVLVCFRQTNYIIDDEFKRKVFVATTRAKDNLFLSFSKENMGDIEFNFLSQKYINFCKIFTKI